MIEEPYRWLEAIGNRREYVREQIKEGSPVLAASLPDGILLLGVGSGNSKVFEVFDRHALAGLGHPADIEKVRQAAIDSAHLEAFNRAPEDVSLRRLVSFGLGPQLKTAFEQIFNAPFLVELLLAELGPEPQHDLLVRLHFDGGFQMHSHRAVVVASEPGAERAAHDWLNPQLANITRRAEAADLMLQTWWALLEKKPFTEELPPEQERREGWQASLQDKTVEAGWLNRRSPRLARFEMLTLSDLKL